VEILEHHERYEKDVKISTSIHEYMKEEKLAIVINFLQENLHQNLTLDDICQNTLLSRSSLQKLFKEGTGHSVMDYFKEMKMQEIKHLIREENHNFTEIAEILGYSSIHYLSRTFKANTGMTLSEYASSVKALLDN
jgi:AraC-like DNA-binding protein